jgi:hypothetical protein
LHPYFIPLRKNDDNLLNQAGGKAAGGCPQTRRYRILDYDIKLMAMVMGLPFVAGMVMLMGLQFNGLVLVDMSLLILFMGMSMFMHVGMRVCMLMAVGMLMLLIRVGMGVLMHVLVSVLMFMGVVVLAFHLNHLLSLFMSLQYC